MMFKKTLLTLGIGIAVAYGVTTPAAEPSDIVARQTPPPQPPPQQQQPSELVLALDNPSYQPRIGIPDFVALGGDAELQAAVKTLADVLAADLDFEREFLVVDRKASAAIPTAGTAEAIDYERWRQIGADFVIFATARRAGAEFTIDLKLLVARAAAQGQQRFGSEYAKCTMANPRYCAHFIADDMHMKIRQVLGVARTKIAFASDRDGTRQGGRFDSGSIGKEIYISDYDGANQRPATANRSLNINPTWLPDARGLAYASYVSRFPDIYVSLFDGRPPTRPAGGTDVIQNTLPAVSPDGTRIAFASGRAGRYDVYVVNRDGSNMRNLTPNTPNSDEGAPTWSPLGNQIAFTSDRTGNPQIWVVNADGLGPPRRLTSDTHADAPTWSSLNYIAYTLGGGPGHDIAVIDLSKQEVRVLTDGLGSNKQPTVAPNARHIAFVTTRWGREQIAIIDYPTGGKTIRRVTEAGNNTYPDWSPVPGGAPATNRTTTRVPQ
jgi:TolB protein